MARNLKFPSNEPRIMSPMDRFPEDIYLLKNRWAPQCFYFIGFKVGERKLNRADVFRIDFTSVGWSQSYLFLHPPSSPSCSALYPSLQKHSPNFLLFFE